MQQPNSAQSTSLVARVSLHYIANILGPFLVASGAFVSLPWRWSALACGTATIAWSALIAADGAEFKEGRPDPSFSKDHWLLNSMRAYLQVTFHRASEVQQKLVAGSSSGVGQAVFSAFPHGVNCDFRILMDGLMAEAFPAVAPARTLVASILFRIPGVRELALKTGCIDAGRSTAKNALSKGLSLMVLPGGLDEQLQTVHGRERVYLQKRVGFVKLAMEHGVPLVPVYVFGCSDLYHTSRALLRFRLWLARTLRIAFPIYWGGWGLYYYPIPNGFPLPVAQNVVFGDPVQVPHVQSPSHEEVAAQHRRFVASLQCLFEEHKARFGAGGRVLEVL